LRRSLEEEFLGDCHGKPKAYRYVLRQSRDEPRDAATLGFVA
jgi:hypothetical protein